MRPRFAFLVTAIASTAAFPLSSARASADPTLTSGITLFFHQNSSPPHDSVFDGSSGAPVLTVPSVIDMTIDPSVLGPGLLNWASAANWAPVPLDMSGFSIGVSGPGSYTAVINNGSANLDVLHSIGPTASTALVTVQFTSINGDTSAGFTVDSNQVNTQFNVTIPANAHLTDNQFQVDLQNLTVQHGGSLINNIDMTVQGNLTNHGSGDFGGTVQGNLINDALSANGDVARCFSMVLNGQLQNSGELQIPSALTTNAVTSNAGTIQHNGGSLLINANFTNLGNYQFSGGSINGPTTFINNATFQWTGGALNSNLTNNSANFTITGASEFIFGGSTVLTNAGTITQSGGSNLQIGTSATLVNQNGALYDITDDSGISNGFNGGFLTNAGVLRKSGGSGTSTIAVNFSNSGTVRVTSGTLAFTGGGTLTGGGFDVDPGKNASFGGGTFDVQASISATGGGSVAIAGGVVTTSTFATFTNFTAGTNLVITGGTLRAETGGNFNLNLTGTSSVLMSGGSIGGNGTVTNLGNFLLSGTASITGNLVNASASFTITGDQPFLSGSAFSNTGTITESGNANFTFNLGGVLTNQPGGLYDFISDSGIANGFNGGTFNNAGNLRKSAGPISSMIAVAFNNTGTITVSSGTLSFQGGGALMGGSFSFSNGGTASFVSGQFSLLGSISATGNGAVSFGGAAGTVLNGNAATFANFTGGATLLVSSGSLAADAGGSLTLNLTGASFVSFTGGSIGGAGIMTNIGNFQWTGGFIAGNFANTSQTFTITGTQPSIFAGTLSNTGTIAQFGNNSLSLGRSGTLDNQVGGLYDLQDDSSLNIAFGSGNIINAGTFRKSGGTGTSFINVPFSNLGTVKVTSGTLSFGGGVTQIAGTVLTAGTWIVGANSSLSLANNPIMTNAASITLTGSGAAFPNIVPLQDNQGSFSLTNGAAFTTAGDIANSGNFSVDAASSFGGTGNFTNSGNTTLAGTQNWSPATTFTNNAGGNAAFLSDAGSGLASPLSIVVNAGNVSLSGPQHLAAINALGGTVTLSGGTTRTSALTLAGSAGNWTGRVDLKNAKLIVEDTTATHAQTLANLKDQAAFAASHANAAGVFATGQASGKIVVVLDNAVEQLSTFGQMSVDGGSILALATFPGDANLDGQVNITDLNLLAAHWQAHVNAWSLGDFNGDGIVNIADLNALAADWQKGVGAAAGESFGDATASITNWGGTAVGAVPEPAALPILGIAGLSLAFRRRCAAEP